MMKRHDAVDVEREMIDKSYAQVTIMVAIRINQGRHHIGLVGCMTGK